MNVVNAASEFRWVNRNDDDLADADFEVLVTNGYLDSELYGDGAGDSVIETDITASPGEDPAVVTYDAGDDASCNWLLDRATNGKWANVDADNAENGCADSVITVAIE